MSRLQTIENRLKEINGTVFQELCDSYLTIRDNNYLAISRTGSQTGKQKTTKEKILKVKESIKAMKEIEKLEKEVIKLQKNIETKKAKIEELAKAL